MSSTCETIVERSGDQSSAGCSKTYKNVIERIISSSDVISRLDIIADENTSTRIDSSHIGYFKVPNEGSLVNIIRRIIALESQEKVIIKINPVRKLYRNSFSDSNTFSFDSWSGVLAMDIMKRSYESIPNLCRFGTVKIKKESKKGHGSKDFVSWTHNVEISTKENGFPEEVAYVVQKLFSSGEIEIYTSGVDKHMIYTLLGCQEELNNQVLQKTKFLSGKVSLPYESFNEELQDESFLIDLYEYLTMITFEFQQLIEEQDPYISTYTPPVSTTSDALKDKFCRTSLNSVHPFLLQSIWDLPWAIISIVIEKEVGNNILLYRDKESETTIAWICK